MCALPVSHVQTIDGADAILPSTGEQTPTAMEGAVGAGTPPRSAPAAAPEAAPGVEKGMRKTASEKHLRILEAAARLFGKRGFQDVCVDHIAEAAGVGKGTVFRYFQTKENLFLAIVHHAVDLALADVKLCVAGQDDVLGQLRCALMGSIRFFSEHGGLFRVLHHDKTFRCSQEREDLLAKRRGLRDLMERILRRGIDEGALRGVDAEFTATMLYGMMRSVMFGDYGDRTPEQLAGMILDLVLHGIESR